MATAGCGALVTIIQTLYIACYPILANPRQSSPLTRLTSVLTASHNVVHIYSVWSPDDALVRSSNLLLPLS